MTESTPHGSSSDARCVGEWTLSSVLGSGSYAVVWRAQHRSTSQLAAIKEINLSRLNAKLRQSLESEVSVLQQVSHVNCVRLIQVLETDDKLFLVTEYCSGGDLAAILRSKGALPEAAVRKLMKHLAAGLQSLWVQHLVHRDLKPQNLLLSAPVDDPEHVLKVADFGFARALGPQLLAETLCGSPLYMAPEILLSQRYDAKADLWSVGAILYEMLVGKPPYVGANQVALLRSIRDKEARLPVNVAATLSPACCALVHSLLKRNPVERISFEEFFSHPFLLHNEDADAATNDGGRGDAQSGHFRSGEQLARGGVAPRVMHFSPPTQHIAGFEQTDAAGGSQVRHPSGFPPSPAGANPPTTIAAAAAAAAAGVNIISGLSAQLKTPSHVDKLPFSATDRAAQEGGSCTTETQKAEETSRTPRLVSMRRPLRTASPPPPQQPQPQRQKITTTKMPAEFTKKAMPSMTPGGLPERPQHPVRHVSFAEEQCIDGEVEEGFVLVSSPSAKPSTALLAGKTIGFSARGGKTGSDTATATTTAARAAGPLTAGYRLTTQERPLSQPTSSTREDWPSTAHTPGTNDGKPRHDAFFLPPLGPPGAASESDLESGVVPAALHAVPWQSASRREFLRLVASIFEVLAMEEFASSKGGGDIASLTTQLSCHLAALQLFQCVLQVAVDTISQDGAVQSSNGSDVLMPDNSPHHDHHPQEEEEKEEGGGDLRQQQQQQQQQEDETECAKELTQESSPVALQHQRSKLHLSMQSSFTSADSGPMDTEALCSETRAALARAKHVASAIQAAIANVEDDASAAVQAITLPNPWQLAHRLALSWADEAAAEELLGNYERSERLYAKASMLLHFLASETTSLPCDNDSLPAVPAQDEAQLRRCAVAVASRWAVCVVATLRQEEE